MRISSLPLVAAFILLLLFAEGSTAAWYGYTPKAMITLGGGFDPRKPDQLFLPCLDYTEPPKSWTEYNPLAPSGTAASTTFTLDKVDSRRKLYEYLNVSASLSGSYSFFSGGGTYLSEDEYIFDEENFHWIIKAYSNYGEFSLRNPRLNSAARTALARGPGAFYQRCGTEWVGQVTRGVLVAVVYTIRNLKEEEKHRIEASFRASAGVPGTWDVSLGLDYKKFIAEALQVGTLSVHVYAIGGRGLPAIAGLVTEAENIDRVKEILQSYTSDLTVANSVPLSYGTGSFGGFDAALGSIDYGNFATRLQEYLVAYEEIQAQRTRIYNVLRSARARSFNEGVIKELGEAYDAYGDRLRRIESQAIECRDAYNIVVAAARGSKNYENRSAKCSPLTADTVARANVSIPDVLPFRVSYWTQTLGVGAPIRTLWVSIEGDGMDQALLVSKFNSAIRTYESPLEVLELGVRSDGKQVSVNDFDLDKILSQRPLALAVRMKSGFMEYYELTLPDPVGGQGIPIAIMDENASGPTSPGEMSAPAVEDASKSIKLLPEGLVDKRLEAASEIRMLKFEQKKLENLKAIDRSFRDHKD